MSKEFIEQCSLKGIVDEKTRFAGRQASRVDWSRHGGTQKSRAERRSRFLQMS